MTPALEVITPGLMTTVQDLGRFGGRAQGIPPSGALDRDSLHLANRLVGNDGEVGALEIRLLGPELRVLADSIRIALVGTGTPIEVTAADGQWGDQGQGGQGQGRQKRTHAPGRSVILHRGDVLRVGSVRDSAACYLAIGGGFDLPAIYGSQSTYLPGGFGGFHGRCLMAGDLIPLNQRRVVAVDERYLPGPVWPDAARPNADPPDAAPDARPDAAPPIRVVLGPQDGDFTAAGVETFLKTRYRVSGEVNRMGMRLEGAQIEHRHGFNIASDGVVAGAVQVPGHGLPIILLADCQTTGGYPKIATVISADLPRLGRLLPGAEVRFASVGIIEAEALARQHHDGLMARIDSITPLSGGEAIGSGETRGEAMGGGETLEDLLLSENLISGAIAED